MIRELWLKTLEDRRMRYYGKKESTFWVEVVILLSASIRLELVLLSFSKLFCAIMDRNPGSLAEILIVRSLIAIQESPPPAHVIDQNLVEVGRSGLNYPDQFL